MVTRLLVLRHKKKERSGDPKPLSAESALEIGSPFLNSLAYMSAAIGVIPYLVKSCRQDMLQEAAHIAFWQARKVNG
jgi:hypothetical protein